MLRENRFKKITNQMILELVVMNEDLCLHNGDFDGNKHILAFPQPICHGKKKAQGLATKIEICCSICDHVYSVASERLRKDINHLEECEGEVTNEI